MLFSHLSFLSDAVERALVETDNNVQLVNPDPGRHSFSFVVPFETFVNFFQCRYVWQFIYNLEVLQDQSVLHQTQMWRHEYSSGKSSRKLYRHFPFWPILNALYNCRQWSPTVLVLSVYCTDLGIAVRLYRSLHIRYWRHLWENGNRLRPVGTTRRLIKEMSFKYVKRPSWDN